MSILNVNQIQPVGGGNTITVSASDISASGATITATSFVGDLTGNVTGNVTGNITGTTSNASGATGDFSIADKIVHTGDTNTAIRFPAADTFTVETAGSERLRITSGGNIGINKTNPDAALVVYDPAGSLSLTKELTAEFRRADDTYNPRLQIRHSSEGTDLHHTWSTNAGNFTFSNGGTEALRINSAGLVGIATAVPSYRLDIGDGATDPANGYQLRVNAAGDYIFALQRQSNASFSIRNNSTGTVHLNTQNSKILSFGVSSGNVSGSIEDDVRIDSSGHLTILDGNLVVASGHGIDFSSTSDTSGMSSELLDDYEEGIHTVAFTASTSGSVTVSSGNDQVSYVKIGNHVTVTGRPVITSVSSPQGNLRMTLPFTSSDLSDAAGRAACALNVRLINSGYKVGMMSAYLDEGSNVLNFSYGDNNDSQASAPAIKSGTQIWINISYRTT